MFALRGTAHLGALRLDAAGLSNDVHALGDLDLDATLSTDDSGAIWPLPDALARLRPLVVRGHVTHGGRRWTGNAVVGALADGQVTGSAQLDTSRKPAALSLALAAHGLEARGDSPRALAANANGTLGLWLAPGASVSRRLDARLGLDGGQWLRSLLDPSARVPVQCGAATLALAHGIATSRDIVVETPDTALAARGRLDLGEQTLELTLTPTHKKPSLLTLDRSIHAQGPWRDVRITLVKATGDTPARCPPR